MKKIFPLWVDDSDINKIKDNAKKERQSANQYILKKALDTPNLATGDWWDNPEQIRRVVNEVKKELKKK